MTADVERAAVTLAAKHAELDSQLGTMSERPEVQGGISFGKRVGEGTAMAVERLSQVAAHEQLSDLRREVVRAEQKIAEGTWGCCDECGEAIPAERLEVRPWATHCVRHA